jgi:hypothetical protein
MKYWSIGTRNVFVEISKNTWAGPSRVSAITIGLWRLSIVVEWELQ